MGKDNDETGLKIGVLIVVEMLKQAQLQTLMDCTHHQIDKENNNGVLCPFLNAIAFRGNDLEIYLLVNCEGVSAGEYRVDLDL